MTADRSPVDYDDPQAWCDWRNSEMRRRDVKWIVGKDNIPRLVDDEEFSARRAEQQARQQEDERRRHNWRIMHPITEEGYAA